LEISKKICMLGTFGVGKTSLVRRFVYNMFDEKYLSTIGVHISQKKISLDVKNQLKLIIWDIAHIEQMNEMIKSYFRGSHGAIIVFDVSRPFTLKDTKVIIKSYLDINPDSKLFFVGNKIDLVDGKSNDMEQFLQFINPYNSPYLLTSAKTGENVEQLFQQIGESVLKTNE